MGRREAELATVVCTKLSANDAGFLRGYARACYNANIIEQPTISHVLRHIVTIHRNMVVDKKKPMEHSTSGQPKGSSASLPNAGDVKSRDKALRNYLGYITTLAHSPLPDC